jgi:hypothetical protein
MESFWNDILSFFENIWAEIVGFFQGLFGGNED